MVKQRLFIRTGSIILLFVFVALPFRGLSQPSEYLLKAVFLEKISRFIEWPENHAASSQEENEFVIGIAGDNPFGPNLNQLYKDQKIKNKNVKIKYLSSVQDLEGCHLLFIAPSDKGEIQQLIQSVKKKPILTVSDSDELRGSGVIINLLVKDKKIGLEIDEKAVQDSGLQVSYLLLKEASIIHPVRTQE